jgi:hypothetical protein
MIQKSAMNILGKLKMMKIMKMKMMKMKIMRMEMIRKDTENILIKERINSDDKLFLTVCHLNYV